MKKQTIHNIIMGSLALFSGYLYAISQNKLNPQITTQTLPTLNNHQEEKNAFYYLNQLRKGSGLIDLKENKQLNLSAKNHASYLIKNYKIGHYEDKNLTQYTGKYASHRSISAGYKTRMLIENVSSNNLDYKTSIDGLMAAIYHRFAFLDFHINEIGIGVNQSKQQRERTAYVYNMGSTYLNDLCKKENFYQDKKKLNAICANPNIKIEQELFNQALDKNKYLNSPIVIYPFKNQTKIPPAFYEELPDPLPEYSVSGFPISISFNEARFKSIKIKSFKLFTHEKKEVKEVIKYNHQTDPNKKLKKFEFVLFPLKRLEWNQKYFVEITYMVNKINKIKKWSFKTKSFQEPFHSVEIGKVYKIKKGEKNIFYFPPLSKKDILGDLMFPNYLDINFIDKNTIELRAKEEHSQPILLQLGLHTLKISIKE